MSRVDDPPRLPPAATRFKRGVFIGVRRTRSNSETVLLRLDASPDGVKQPGDDPAGKLVHAFETQFGRITLRRCVDRTEKIVPEAKDDAKILSMSLVGYQVMVPDVQPR
jgi:hypothetical protein